MKNKTPAFLSLKFKLFLLSPLLISLLGCATSTDSGVVGADRQQFFLMGSEQVVSMSAEAYEKTKSEARQSGTLDRNSAQVARVNQIAKKLIPVTGVFRRDAPAWAWEVHVITSNELNAYCMAGGKIMFYSGIIEKLNLTDAEIAAIMGHEIAHALREHSRERMSQAMIQQIGLGALLATGQMNEKYAGAAAAGLSLAITLPHGRGQESEADNIGVELMARAGFNPEEAVSLWRKMSAQGGGKPPQFLSTHPSDETRINNIQSLLPKVTPLYLAARSR